MSGKEIDKVRMLYYYTNDDRKGYVKITLEGCSLNFDES